MEYSIYYRIFGAVLLLAFGLIMVNYKKFSPDHDFRPPPDYRVSEYDDPFASTRHFRFIVLLVFLFTLGTFLLFNLGTFLNPNSESYIF